MKSSQVGLATSSRYMIASMNISVRKKKDVAIVDFVGRLAAGVGDSMLPQLVGQILEEGYKKIRLNLSGMDYIDSNGLGELNVVMILRSSLS